MNWSLEYWEVLEMPNDFLKKFSKILSFFASLVPRAIRGNQNSYYFLRNFSKYVTFSLSLVP